MNSAGSKSVGVREGGTSQGIPDIFNNVHVWGFWWPAEVSKFRRVFLEPLCSSVGCRIVLLKFPTGPSECTMDMNGCRKKYGTTKVVTGSAYLDALQLWLFPQLEESEPNNFIWQQDGAPPNWRLSVRDWLNITVPNQWIGRKEPPDKTCIAWPPRSPDLMSCDFYMWGLIKDCVYIPPLPAEL
ncbi:uncharacterized protein TNCV_3708961 [Trichonephila clavipes]|nr:uncharacterized protein TNCV_3708961 [Trichonephila clavipes]